MSEIRGRLLLSGRLAPGLVRFERGRITSIEEEALSSASAALPIVAPGFIDLHVHGFGGFDPVGDLAAMARALARAGTTAFQPTLFPEEPSILGATCEHVSTAAASLASVASAAQSIGLHLEGPFVNPARAGALPPESMATPSLASLSAILGPATGSGRSVRTMTLAPELPGASALIEELVRCGVRVSMGHSSATAIEARGAARAGARGATHLFNAMGPLHHREVGLAGLALTERAVFAELIGDLVHVAPEAIAIALAARGPHGLCLVSDALPGAGTGCEVFHWRGREHLLRDGAAFLKPDAPGGAPRLAGAAVGQLEMVRRLVRAGAVSLPEALTMASETPARALGLERERGILVPGARADFVILRGPELELLDVRIAGVPVAPS